MFARPRCRGTGAYLTPLEGTWEHTDMELEDGEIVDPMSDPEEGEIIDSPRVHRRHLVYSQASVSDDDLMLRRISLQLIDHGGFGVVYDCQLDGRTRLVLKVPKALLDDDVLCFNAQTRRIERGPGVSPSAQEKADRTFGYEFAIGERIIDTPTMRRNYVARAAPGQRIQGMSEADFRRHEQELALMRTHPGFPHIVQMVHYCPSIPCIFMSPWCDGTSEQLYENGSLLAHQDAFAGQTLLAMEYLHDVAGVANTDIKFANVLYQTQGGALRFILSDYGGCAIANQPWISHYICTTGYAPPDVNEPNYGLPVWDPYHVKPFAVSVYTYAAMLMYLLLPAYDPTAAAWCKLNGTACVQHVDDAIHPIACTDDLLASVLEVLRAHPDDVLDSYLAQLRQNIPHMPPRDRRFSAAWRQFDAHDRRFDRLEFGPGAPLPPPPAWPEHRC